MRGVLQDIFLGDNPAGKWGFRVRGVFEDIHLGDNPAGKLGH